MLAGYAVAPTLAGVALLFAFGGALFGVFDIGDLGFLPSRVFGIITNQTLIAVPLFVLMGVTLQRTHIAETLLKSLSTLLGSARGGLGMAVIVVGMLMAASTGIVGATVVTMGLISLPAMLRQGYDSNLPPGPSAPPEPLARSSRLPLPWCCSATCCRAHISRRN